jgi:hypothetical protein
MPGSPALTLLADMPPGGAFFDIALFRGALGPDVESDWTRGWTTFAQR